jgi:S-adenosylmethionine:tRNA ribosyltransferase-isomerase
MTAPARPAAAAPPTLQCVPALPFELPERLIATGPPEAYGVSRDGVRLLVATPDGLGHRRAYQLPAALRPGDLLVLNTSDTLPAALTGVAANGEHVLVHLSTVRPDAGVAPAAALRSRHSPWVVELRTPSGRLGGEVSTVDRSGTRLRLSGGGTLRVEAAYPDPHGEHRRLWTAELDTPAPLRAWLAEHGHPIRYGYVTSRWPLSAYRTTYADTPGSAEMPSAGRPLTARTFRRLRARGVATAGLVLHAGVSSPEHGEPPYPEWYSVPASTLGAVEQARRAGRRVIAVGTTVVRALESAVDTGRAEGWTDLVVTSDRRLSAVDGLLTGWHPPQASHLQLLTAVAGVDLLCASYRAALQVGYRWHEFGDVHLILPAGSAR